MFSDYIFYDGLLKEIKRNYTEKSLHLLIECRNKQEKWLLLQVVCSGIAFCRIEEHNGNQEILSEPLRVLALPDGMLLVTLDDETVSDPEQLKNNGKFVIICQNVSCRERRELIQTERELLDYIDLPEVEPGSLKFIFNDQKKKIDLECIFADGKGLLCENIQQLQINENFNYGLIGSSCFLSVRDISANGMESCRWAVEEYEENAMSFYCETLRKVDAE